MDDLFHSKESVNYKFANSVLVNTHPSIFDKSILWSDKNIKLYINIYDYVTSQLQMFVMKTVVPERDLNSYINAKDFLENFVSTGNLKHLDSMVSNYRKVFNWFIADLAVVMLKTVTENPGNTFVSIVPTIPKILWSDDDSPNMRNKRLSFDFKEKELKDLQGTNFNCIVLNHGIVDEFMELSRSGEIDLMEFSSKILLNKIPLIDEWYSLDEMYHSIMGKGEPLKSRMYTTVLLYLYTLKVGIRCLIDER